MTSSLPEHWDYNEEQLLDNVSFIQILSQCIGLLPEIWRLCVQFKYVDDRKSDAICQELGITLSNYWQIIHRAKLQLRGCIEE
ncbi:MAG: sigma factor-like helix-turn-helix DNA-binding protein, partial [Perlabentimonas sp.]